MSNTIGLTVEVKFLDDDGNILTGELINPFRLTDREVYVYGAEDGAVDIYVRRGDAAQDLFRTPLIRVASMTPYAEVA